MTEMLPTPYPELNIVLQDLVRSVQVVLRANFVGAYLQGSFADYPANENCIAVTIPDK